MAAARLSAAWPVMFHSLSICTRASAVWRLSSITSARHILQLRNKFTHFTYIIPRHSSYGALKSFAFNHIEQWRK